MTEPTAELEQFMALLKCQEPLHPELEPYLEEDDRLPCLRHPMLYSVPYSPVFNAMLNRHFEHKQAALADALAKRDLTKAVMMYERPWRLWGFTQHYLSIQPSDREYWETLGWIWTDSENVRQNLRLWNRLFSHEGIGREFMMEPAEREALAAMPDEFEVYRGTAVGDREGMSRTIRKSIAEWFARRVHALHGAKTCVLRARVRKENVIAHFTERGESEIVVLPKHLIGIEKVR